MRTVIIRALDRRCAQLMVLHLESSRLPIYGAQVVSHYYPHGAKHYVHIYL